ncbi:Uncharacterised protein [Vibrio owensii]|nr:Uncharacterised protein [Vibrio owensii]
MRKLFFGNSVASKGYLSLKKSGELELGWILKTI